MDILTILKTLTITNGDGAMVAVTEHLSQRDRVVLQKIHAYITFRMPQYDYCQEETEATEYKGKYCSASLPSNPISAATAVAGLMCATAYFMEKLDKDHGELSNKLHDLYYSLRSLDFKSEEANRHFFQLYD